MKTVVTEFDVFEGVRFFLVDGDKSHLNGVCIGSSRFSDELKLELFELLYDTDGVEKYEELHQDDAISAVFEDKHKMIVVGFL